MKKHMARGCLFGALTLLLGAAPAQAGNFCARDADRGHAWNAQTGNFTQTPSTISGLSQVLGSRRRLCGHRQQPRLDLERPDRRLE